MSPVICESAASLSIQRLCVLAGIPRSGYYRMQQVSSKRNGLQHEQLRQEVHAVCAQWSHYGYRRVTRELRRQGRSVGLKRIRALMLKDNLRCRPKKRWIQTTDSKHGYRIYPNLARQMMLDRPNQLWVADITYIHLIDEFVYLAVILDAFSRCVVGWALARHIDTHLTKSALEMALATRTIEAGLVHHSDRGAQYASTDYVALLQSKNISVSMSRTGNPYDNAKAESFMKTLKTEEVSISEYDTIAEARVSIGNFIEIVYNQRRLHSALDYRPPAEFEAEYIKSQNTLFTLTPEKTVSL